MYEAKQFMGFLSTASEEERYHYLGIAHIVCKDPEVLYKAFPSEWDCVRHEAFEHCINIVDVPTVSARSLRARKSKIVHTPNSEEDLLEAVKICSGPLAMLFTKNYVLETIAKELENETY